MPGLHSRHRHGAKRHGESEIDRDKVAGAARTLLDQATTGEAWIDPHGQRHIPILVAGAVVGSLRVDADLAAVEVARYWAARFGAKVELTHYGEVVGMLRVSL
jgi:hypothetical protein